MYLLEMAASQLGDATFLEDDKYRGRGLGAEVHTVRLGLKKTRDNGETAGLNNEKLDLINLRDHLVRAFEATCAVCSSCLTSSNPFSLESTPVLYGNINIRTAAIL